MLRALHLGGNQLGDEGVAPLAKAVAENYALEELDLPSNGIGDAGAVALASAMLVNRHLRSLELWGNRVTARGGAGLTTAQRENPRLEHLGLENNRMDVKGRVEMLESLVDNQRSRDLGGRGVAGKRKRAHRGAAPREARGTTHAGDDAPARRPVVRTARDDKAVGERQRLLEGDAAWRHGLHRGTHAYFHHASPWEGYIDAPPILDPSDDPTLPAEYRNGKVAYMHHSNRKSVNRGFSLLHHSHKAPRA